MTQLLMIKSHTRSKPHSAIRAQTTAKLRREVDQQAAIFRRMERDLNRLVAFNVRESAR